MKNTSLNLLALAASVTAIGFLAGCNTAPTASSAGGQPADAALSARVQSAIAHEPTLREDKITVMSTDGVICLTGNVASQDEKHRAYAIASMTPGVESVEDNMSVK